jgi:ribosome-associated protein
VKTRRTRIKSAATVGGRALPRPPRKTRPPEQTPSEKSQEIALWAARAGLEKKAAAVEIVDVIGKVDYADYLVLMTGNTDRHVAAIADAVDGLLAEHGVRAISVEGLPAASWVLIDFVDVVVHVFQADVRAVYDLDGLWMDARRVPVPGAPDAE